MSGSRVDAVGVDRRAEEVTTESGTLKLSESKAELDLDLIS